VLSLERQLPADGSSPTPGATRARLWREGPCCRTARRRGGGAATVVRVERLILARPGESDYSARGLLHGGPGRRCPLTPTGRVQAQRLGTLLRVEPIDLCVTSAFERTKETAEIALAGRRAIPRLVVHELNDHPAGKFEGLEIAEYIAWAHASPSREPIPGAAESRLEAV